MVACCVFGTLCVVAEHPFESESRPNRRQQVFGLVRRKNQLSVSIQGLACACVMSVMWFAFGY